MSGVTTASVITAAAAVAGVGASIYSSQQQAKSTKSASDQATKNAQDAAATQAQALNKATSKSPNTGVIDSENANAAAGGPSSTMLTGPGGVDPSTLNLGKNTLLGM